MTTARLIVRGAAATAVCGASLVFGFAGPAHAHGTWTPPVEPRSPMAHPHHGPFSVLHQRGPFSVLHPAGSTDGRSLFVNGG